MNFEVFKLINLNILKKQNHLVCLWIKLHILIILQILVGNMDIFKIGV